MYCIYIIIQFFKSKSYKQKTTDMVFSKFYRLNLCFSKKDPALSSQLIFIDLCISLSWRKN